MGNAICLKEIMEWIIDHGHAIIKEEAGSGQFQVKVKPPASRCPGVDFVVFTATPEEKYSALKARVAKHLGLGADYCRLMFNGHCPATGTTLREWGVGSGDTLTSSYNY